jgi:hypothetical protein
MSSVLTIRAKRTNANLLVGGSKHQQEASNKDLEEDAQNFIQDQEEPQLPFPLDETQEPPKPPIVLKPFLQV